MIRAHFLTRLGLAFVLGGVLALPAIMLLAHVEGDPAGHERVEPIRTGEGRFVNALVLTPEAASGRVKGAVILLAGGHGNLGLAANGTLRWGAGNQLVRTRHLYARRGYLTIVPDIADAFKVGNAATFDYRWSRAHVADLAAIVGYARGRAGPVHVVGTSRAALSVFALGSERGALPRPASLVVTSGLLLHTDPQQPSVERNIAGIESVSEPTLLLYHAADACPLTPPSGSQRFRALLSGARAVDVVGLDGGETHAPDPCQADTHHGFLGIDTRVVDRITAWLDTLRPDG